MLILIISILVIARPERHTVTPVYRNAAHAWQTGAKLYHVTDGHGYQYLPAAAILYLPITLLPEGLGEVLWRWLCIGLFVSALWRLARAVGGERESPPFLLITLLCLPATLSSARNGQFNLPLAALLLHGALDLGQQRWNRAAVVLAFAFALKTVALPMLLLAAVIYRPMRFRAVIGPLLVLCSPFLFATTSYVVKQYELYWAKMHVLGDPNECFCNLHGIAQSLGLALPANFYLIAALAAGLLVLVFALRFRGSTSNSTNRALMTFALFTSYLMLFNPKTETNSYVILAPAIAAPAVARGLAGGWAWDGRMLTALALCLGVENYGGALFRATDFWLKPLVALIFLAYLFAACWRQKGFIAATGANPLSPSIPGGEKPKPTTTQ